LLKETAMLTALATALLLSVEPSNSVSDDDLRDEAKVVHTPSTTAGRAVGAGVGVFTASLVTAGTSTTAFFVIWGATGFKGLCLWSCQENDATGLAAALVTGLAIDALGALFLTPLGAQLGHQAAGGEGSYGAALAGGAIGLTTGIGLGALGLQQVLTGDGANDVLGWTLVALGAGAFFTGPILGLELSHASATRVGVAPTKGGGMVSLSVAL
jgi:hypothetical protein